MKAFACSELIILFDVFLLVLLLMHKLLSLTTQLEVTDLREKILITRTRDIACRRSKGRQQIGEVW